MITPQKETEQAVFNIESGMVKFLPHSKLSVVENALVTNAISPATDRNKKEVYNAYIFVINFYKPINFYIITQVYNMRDPLFR